MNCQDCAEHSRARLEALRGIEIEEHRRLELEDPRKGFKDIGGMRSAALFFASSFP